MAEFWTLSIHWRTSSRELPQAALAGDESERFTLRQKNHHHNNIFTGTMTSGQRESPQCTNRLNTFSQKLFKQFQHQMTCTSLLHVRLFLKMHGAILLVIESAPLSEDEDERNWLQPDVKVVDLCML